MKVETTMLTILKGSPKMAIQPCTIYQLKNIGRKAMIAMTRSRKEKSSTRKTKMEEMSSVVLKSERSMLSMPAV